MKKVFIYAASMFFFILIIPLMIVGLGGQRQYYDRASPTDVHRVGIYPTYEPEHTPGEDAEPVETIKKEENANDYVIKVYNTAEKKVFETNLEEYILSVVLAEMPAVFELEALKAQCVAARTYTYKKLVSGNNDEAHNGANICTSSAHCQAWRAPDAVVDSTPDKSGHDSMAAADKIVKVRRAVAETKGIIACYDGKPIEALYHSCSGGMTEYAENVWDGKGYPYLLPVKSEGEEIADKKYKTSMTISKEVFISKIKAEKKDFSAKESDVFKSITNIKRSDSGRILNVNIGGTDITGKELRKIFGLNSANITFKEDSGNIVMTTLGFGHGVGMSQFGADARAHEGKNFEEILKYYYTGIELKTI